MRVDEWICLGGRHWRMLIDGVDGGFALFVCSFLAGGVSVMGLRV